jgi:hypothetical protein
MIKLLGLADLTAAFLLMSRVFEIEAPVLVAIFFAFYLLIKGFLFVVDIGSVLDIIAAILLTLNIFFVLPGIILIIVASLLGLKGLMSLFSWS